jgi:hypothetical protein
MGLTSMMRSGYIGTIAMARLLAIRDIIAIARITIPMLPGAQG